MTAAEHLDPVAAAAHRYATLGLRVLPIAPGTKYPKGLEQWQQAATTDPDTIDAWWSGLYRGHGVGIALDQLPDGRWAFAIDIDLHSPNGDGSDEWFALCGAHGAPPDTVEAVTGSGGSHLIYAAPAEIRNDQAGKVGPGIDVRGHGGQILVEPTIHPNGNPYAWVDGRAPWEHPIADAPAWLLELVNPPTPEPQPFHEAHSFAGSGTPTDAGTRPGDLWAEQISWGDILTTDGWTFSHTDKRADTDLYTRPGKEVREGVSASVGYGGSDVLKVFTSSAHPLEAGQTYTKLGYLAATRYNGDHSAAASALASAGYHRPDTSVDDWLDSLATAPSDGPSAPLSAAGGTDGTTTADPLTHGWEPTPLAPVLAADYDPPQPTIGPRQGGGHTFYPARVNALYAPSGTGKSWVAMWACAAEMQQGRHAIYVDLEDHPASVAARFAALGLDAATIAAQLTYIAPEQPWSHQAANAIEALCAELRPSVVVIDSTGEAMALDGAAPNDDDDTARWFRRLPRYIAGLGPAVILTDHVAKSKDRAKLFGIGSQRKRAAIDGIAYEVEARVAPAKGTTGHLALICAKDRNGAYQNGHKVAEVDIHSDSAGTSVQIAVKAPDGVFRPTHIMEEVSRYLEENGVSSGGDVKRGVPRKDAHIITANEFLAAEGYIDVRERSGRGGGLEYESLKPFREDADWLPEPVDNPPSDPVSEPVPTHAQPMPARVPDDESEPMPVPPPLRGHGMGTPSGGTENTTDSHLIEAEPMPDPLTTDRRVDGGELI